MKPLQEPLLHFVIAGAILFGAYAIFNRGDEGPAASALKQIRIGAGEAQWLRETFALQRQREPTQEELRGLLAEFLNEELLAREARELKLDQNDTIVRRRLAQKLNFLIEDTLRKSAPTEADLLRLYDARPERYRADASVSFAHVYFSPAQRKDPVSDANKVLAELSRSGSGEQAGAIGDRFLLPLEFRDESGEAVARTFGAEFARKLLALKPQVWGGPVESGYGVHLVRISALQPGQLRPFSEVQAQLMEEWRRDQEKAAKERYLAELHKKFNVVVDDNVKPLLKPAAQMTGRAQ